MGEGVGEGGEAERVGGERGEEGERAGRGEGGRGGGWKRDLRPLEA